MKKCLLLIALLMCFTILFTSCTSFKEPSAYLDLPESYNFGTDYPSSFGYTALMTNFTPGEGGYYFFISNILYFLDEESLQIVPVCNRPECQHWDSACSGYCQRMRTGLLQYYEGKLYEDDRRGDEPRLR